MKTFKQFLNESFTWPSDQPTHISIKDIPKDVAGGIDILPGFKGKGVLAYIDYSEISDDMFVKMYKNGNDGSFRTHIAIYLTKSQVNIYFRKLTQLDKTSMKYGI